MGLGERRARRVYACAACGVVRRNVKRVLGQGYARTGTAEDGGTAFIDHAAYLRDRVVGCGMLLCGVTSTQTRRGMVVGVHLRVRTDLRGRSSLRHDLEIPFRQFRCNDNAYMAIFGGDVFDGSRDFH